MVYFLLIQDPIQVSEAHGTFPAECGKATETGLFHETMTRIIKPVYSEAMAPYSKIHGD